MPGISDVTAEGTKQYGDYIRIPTDIHSKSSSLSDAWKWITLRRYPRSIACRLLLKGRSHAASAQQTLNIAAATTHRTLERLIDRRPKSREVQIRKNQSERVNGL
jgi:hypothetical protein